MKVSTGFLTLLLCLGPILCTTAKSFCPIAELNAFLSGPVAMEANFTIRGVITTSRPHCLTVEDKTGAVCLDGPTTNLPPIGSLVNANVKAAVPSMDDLTPWRDRKEPWAVFEHIEITGKANAPQPQEVDLEALDGAKLNNRLIVTRGTAIDTLPDEIDSRFQLMLLKKGESVVRVSIPMTDGERLNVFRDAEIIVTGRCYRSVFGGRKFLDPSIVLDSVDDIGVVTPPPSNPLDVPELEKLFYVTPKRIASLGRRRLRGTVLATWRTSHLLLHADDGRIAEVTLQTNEALPKPGTVVTTFGYPQADPFRINLYKACWRAEPDVSPRTSAPFDFRGCQPLPSIDVGRLLRVRGSVKRLPVDASAKDEIILESNGRPVAVDVSSTPSAKQGLSVGCEIQATGIFLARNGFTLVARSPRDIRILSHPPWWTPGKLLAVIAGLLLALGAFVVWNRVLNRLVARRGRELFVAQIAETASALKVEERTRLAAELHDALSQNLSAVACQVAAAKSTASSDSETQTLLTTAERMLQSSRTELTRCLWDLRGDALEETDFTRAIKNTLRRLSLKADLHVRFNVLRTRVDDTTAHAILCIVRELVTNAVKHGEATEVRVAGETHENVISFSVRDNGSGFDTERADGTDTGHFGLEGIRDRTNRLNGTFEITSSVGHGAKAVVTLPLGHESTATEFTA